MKNKFEIRGDVTAIFVKYKDKVMETLIDTDDLEKVMRFPNTWMANWYSASNNYYVIGNKPKDANGKRGTERLHRYILDAKDGLVVDHINHDTLDNRKSNIREVPVLINNQNQKGARTDNKSSGLRNVYWNKKRQKWVGKFSLNGKFQHVGFFETVEEANKAVKRARAKLMKGSLDALELTVPEDENVLYDPNKPASTNRTSGVKNVHWHKRAGMWTVVVKRVNYGSYETLEKASEVAEKARKGLIKPLDKGIPNRNNKSGVRGVYWHKKSKKWTVQISVDKKTKNFGWFDNLEDAIKKAEEVRSTLK